MKRVICIISIIGVVFMVGMKKPPKPALTEEQTAAIQKAVLKNHKEMIKAIEKLDVDKFFESIIDSGMGTIIQDGRIMSYKESLDSTKKRFEGITKLKYEFSQENTKVLSPEIAIFTGQGKSTTTIDTGETFTTNFAVTSVFVLKDGQWKIFHGHNSIPNPQQN